MTNPRLKLPADPHSEIYFDSKLQVVNFRKRTDDKKAAAGQEKVLRVVIQCFGWVIEDRLFRPGSVVTVGAGKRNTLAIPTRDLPDRHPLIRYELDGSTQLTLNRHFTGIVQKDGTLQPLAEALGGSTGSLQMLTLAPGCRGVLEHGNAIVYFEEVPAPEKVPAPILFKSLADPYFIRWLLVSLALHFLILLIVKIMPTPPTVVDLEELTPAKKAIVLDAKRFKKIDIAPTRAMSALGLKPGKVGMEGEGARARGKEGRRGKGVPGKGKMSKAQINKTGVLDFFSKGSKSGVLSDLVGGSAVPNDIENAMSKPGRYGLPGERELREGKGLVDRGGTGGGGLSTSIGQGLGTKGKGGGAKGPGLADFGTGRQNVAVSASIDEEEVYIMGSIPKEVIAKIINDHIGEIRYCYERQVQKQPGLRGKIVPTFIIGLQGSVTSTRIKSSTMGSPPVESCVMSVLRRIQFPKPGGGIVEVTYPFLFRVAG